MRRHHKLEDVACAICMESLFNYADELDEVMPIATPDCGHVFHEHCLLEWFKAQYRQYASVARENRGHSPTLSEAPAECPTCRTECFADTETGQPIIHRLFINFGTDNPSSSTQQPSSSPVRWAEERNSGGGKKDKEVMGLARRARAMTREVERLSPESLEDVVGEALKRADGLKEELVSAKALKAIKMHVGGLTTSINKLRESIKTHPLLPTLNDQIIALKADIHNREAHLHSREAHMRQLQDVIFPHELARAVQAERAKADKVVKKAMDDAERIQRELEKEQVARRASRKETAEREADWEKKLALTKNMLEREQADRQQLNDTLIDRTKLLKVYQSKAESRKHLKSQLEELEAENARLKSVARASAEQQVRTIIRDSSEPSTSSPAYHQSYNDLSIEEIPEEVYSQSTRQKRRITADDSLQIDMPSFHDDDDRHLQATSTSRAHPTARTYTFDALTDIFGNSPEKSRKQKSPQKHRADKVSPYFDASAAADGQDHLNSPDRFDYHRSPARRSRTNPFSTTKEESEKRKRLGQATSGQDTSVIDLTKRGHSTLSDISMSSPQNLGRNDKPVPKVATATIKMPLPAQKKPPQRSMAEFLAGKDGMGKGKGLIMGAKSVRRA